MTCRYGRTPSRSTSLFAFVAAVTILACSSPDAPAPQPQLGASYHLRAVDGVSLPIVDAGGASLDSGHFTLLGDSVRIDEITHVPPANGNPGIIMIAFGTYRPVQHGAIVALTPILASVVDTAVITSADTLTVRAHDSGHLQIKLFVAP